MPSALTFVAFLTFSASVALLRCFFGPALDDSEEVLVVFVCLVVAIIAGDIESTTEFTGSVNTGKAYCCKDCGILFGSRNESTLT